MTFEKGGLYRHDSTLDMDLAVMSVILRSDCCTVMEVKYLNRHYGFYQPDMISTEIVRVKKEDEKHWRQIK